MRGYLRGTAPRPATACSRAFPRRTRC